MSENPPKPGAPPAAKPGAPPAAKPAPDWSPKFKTFDTVMRCVLRARMDMELPEPILSAVEQRFEGAALPTEPAASEAWLAATESVLRDLFDAAIGVQGELNEQLADINPAQPKETLKQTEQELQASKKHLRDKAFADAQKLWKERLEKNFKEITRRHDAQAEKLQIDLDLSDPLRVTARPTAAWWSAYAAWLHEAHDRLHQHLCDLLNDRWGTFTEEQVLSAVRKWRADFSIELPTAVPASLSNPIVRAGQSDKGPYREDAMTGTARADGVLQPPEEKVFVADLDRQLSAAAQAGWVGTARNVTPMLGLAALAAPGPYQGMRTVVGGLVAIPLGIVVYRRQKRLKGIVEEERTQKLRDALKKKLLDQFRARLDRTRPTIERFVSAHNAAVQGVITSKLQALIDEELARRKSLLPQERDELVRRKGVLTRQLNILDNHVLKPLGEVMVDLETRRRELQREVARRAREAATSGQTP